MKSPRGHYLPPNLRGYFYLRVLLSSSPRPRRGNGAFTFTGPSGSSAALVARGAYSPSLMKNQRERAYMLRRRRKVLYALIREFERVFGR